jgi:CMP-N,N'-diacetyllegionaminic acid synthase
LTLLAIIPARGGSKGIRRKNLALLDGRPLIDYAINACRESTAIDEILLSTDDDEISDAARRAGLASGYRRPAELAGDASPMIDVIEHALRWVEATRGQLPEEVILLQPTSPLRSASDIDDAVARFRESGARSLVSVHPMGEHPSECITIKNDRWEFLVPPPSGATRRQDYAGEFFFINGAIYIFEASWLLATRKLIDARETATYVMPRERGLDIDTELDLAIAEAIVRATRPSSGGGEADAPAASIA